MYIHEGFVFREHKLSHNSIYFLKGHIILWKNGEVPTWLFLKKRLSKKGKEIERDYLKGH